MPKMIDITGQRFGRWTVLKSAGQASDRKFRWECECVCGTHAVLYGTSLRSGDSQSCGCWRAERPFKDITNQRFGQLIALEPVDQRDGHFFWLCLCDCGATTVVQGKKLRTGHTQTCGHWKQDGSHRRTHGEAAIETPEYITWKSMLQRCRNPNCTSFEYYGGRGIKVCERWSQFENFLSDMGRRPAGYSIERINNDGNYEPFNCKWATHSEQMKNTRRSSRRRAR